MPSPIRVSFKNDEGLSLHGRLELPAMESPKAYVLFAHCFTCGKNLNAARSISRSLNKEGFAVLRFDFTGLGESEGEFAETNFSSNVADLLSAANYLALEYEAPKLLIGHSLGGAAVLRAAFELDSVQAITTIGSPSQPKHVKHLLGVQEERIKEHGQAKVQIGPQQFTIKQQFLEDISRVKVLEHLKDLRKAILIMHSPQDDIVGIENAAEIYNSAWHPKSFISLDGADHLLSKAEDAEYAAGVISSWASRYLNYKAAEHDEVSDGVRANLHESQGFTTEIQAGGYGFLADEPKDIGGAERGPSPYQLVSSGLAACTAMTLQMYAKRKKWPLEEVNVQVDYEKRHGDDCIDCDKTSAKLDHFSRKILIEGDLDQKQIDRLMEIANRCPVHKTLESTSRIETKKVSSL